MTRRVFYIFFLLLISTYSSSMNTDVSSAYCRACRRSFSHVSALRDHIKRDHQQSVKVKFRGDRVVNIERADDGTFQCLCARHFTLPSSLRRHARSCEGDIQSRNLNELREEWSAEQVDCNSEEQSLPIDCVGKFPIYMPSTYSFCHCR